MDKISRLNELHILLNSGVINEEEFNKLKNDVLNTTTVNKPEFNRNKPFSKWIYIIVGSIILTGVVYLLINRKNESKQLKNDLSEYEVNGKVKYILATNWGYFDTEVIYGFNTNGFLVYSKIGDNEINTIERDGLNRVLSSKKYALVGDVGDLYLDGIKKDYQYTSDGKIAFYTTAFSTFDEVSSSITTSLKYDSKGGLIGEIIKDENGVITDKIDIQLKYDKNDSIIEKTTTQNESSYRQTFTYNENGLLSKLSNYNEDGTLDTEYEYSYDENGNKKEEKYSYNGSFKRLNKYVYNKKNQLIRVLEKNQNTPWRRLYEYSYDRNGNWVKRKDYDENGNVSYATRKIVYYTEQELKDEAKFDFKLEFGDKPQFETSSDIESEIDQSGTLSYGELRGRLIGGNSRMLKKQLGEPAYRSVASSYFQDAFEMNLPIGLYDLCLNYEVYVYVDFFNFGENLVVVLSGEKITNIIPETEITNVKDICCCE